MLSNKPGSFAIAALTAAFLLAACSRTPSAGIPAVLSPPSAATASDARQIVSRAFDVRTSKAAEPPIFMMPTPDYYDAGYTPSIAFSGPGTLAEEHTSASGYLWYHVGTLAYNSVSWGDAHAESDDGVEPGIASDGSGQLLEVHRGGSRSDTLYFRLGSQSGSTISWLGSLSYGNGYNPVVAFSGHNTVVEVHSDSSGLGAWALAKLSANKVEWHSGTSFSDGYHPSVTTNSRGTALEVERGGSLFYGSYNLYYRVGRIDAPANTIAWGKRQKVPSALTKETGAFSTVALDDAGNAIMLYICQYPSLYDLGDKFGWCTMTGTLASDQVQWVGPRVLAPPMNYNFLQGHGLESPSVAMQDRVAVGVAQQGSLGLYYGTTMLTDRSNWMGDRLDTSLKGKTLAKIVIPASHDSGMYTGNGAFAGIAQNQNFYEQLSGGQRYFDLRPDASLHIYHGPVTGPSVQSILDDVRRYMQEGHREIVVLKFSHFNFTPTLTKGSPYEKLVAMITTSLQPWFYYNTSNLRLADIPLSTMIPSTQNYGRVLVLVDVPSTFDSTGATGVYTYRDWDSQHTNGAQFSVYDQYSQTGRLSYMMSDQLSKFSAFNGKMEYLQGVPCDLFLLSWTITPLLEIQASAAEADATLGPAMSTVQRNKYGFIPNVLYVDFYSWADPADVAIISNARF